MARSGGKKNPTKPTGFDIIVSGDRLSVKLVQSNRYKPTKSETIQSKSLEFGIKAKLDHEKISHFIQGNVGPKGIVIAHGTAPVDGKNGELRLNRPPEPTPLMTEDGTVDHRSRSPFFFVEKEQFIGDLTLPTLGTRGVDVYGKPLEPKPGIKSRVRPSSNIRLDSENDRMLISEVDGVVRVTQSSIAVETQLTINGDIDYETGNIEFAGDLIVSGDVTAGFIVSIGGQLEIKGSILGAKHVEARRIHCKGGIVGDNSKVIGHESIDVRFAENANIFCYGDVSISHSIINSKVVALGDIIVKKPGRTIGGITAAVGNLTLWQAGAPSEVNTLVMAGIDYYRETELDSRQRSLALIEPEIEKLSTQLESQASETTEATGPNKRAELRLAALERLSQQSRKRVRTLKSELATTQDIRNGAFCRIEGTIHPGTQVTVSGAKRRFVDESSRLEFRNLDGELVSTVILK